jgi:hypothetical protein
MDGWGVVSQGMAVGRESIEVPVAVETIKIAVKVDDTVNIAVEVVETVNIQVEVKP